MSPRNKISQPPVQQHQNQSDVDGDQTIPFAKMQKKTGMVNIKSNSGRPTKTFKHKIHSRRTLSRPKTCGKFRLGTLSALKTIRYHKIPSPPRHNPLMYCTDTQNKSSIRREWEEKMERLNEKYCLDCFSDSELKLELDEGKNHQYEHIYETLI